MSGATYRIDVEHRPQPEYAFQPELQWLARIVRLSDGLHVESVWGATDQDAIARARSWLFAQHEAQTGSSLYVNDEGEVVKA